MEQHWNDRYGAESFAYGEQPNEFLKEQLSKLSPGNILFPADGEGRNSVYAATQGWSAFAFDMSIEGKKKAMLLAAKHNTSVNYQVGEFDTLSYKPEEFDAIALIYAHFPADKKSGYHKKLTAYLRLGGTLIFEAFSKKHLDYATKNPAVGGPKESGMLFSTDEIKNDFQDYEIVELLDTEVELAEGEFHNGLGSVIRFVGRRK